MTTLLIIDASQIERLYIKEARKEGNIKEARKEGNKGISF